MTNRLESSSPRRLACENCGTEFSCGLSGACWCADESFRMPMPARDGGDCLCPDCLRRLATQSASGAAS